MTEVVELVRFGFMTDEEARKLSVVKITNPDLNDILGNPVPGGLYDPAMGPMDERLCKTCGENACACTGHCGHIPLAYPVYNPLLFTMLNNILSKTCFQCHQFRSSRREVENLVYQLELIRKGDMVEAKKLSLRQSLRNSKTMPWPILDDEVDREDSSHSTVHSDNECHYEDNKQACWDSYQLTEAMTALSDFLKRKTPKCPNCEFKNPKITRPTFGWFHVKGIPSHQIRANIIQGRGLDVTQSAGSEDMHSSGVQNASDSPWKEDSWTAEADSSVSDSNGTKKRSKDGKRNKQLYQGLGSQASLYSGHLLQAEVRDILSQLWVNEAPLCKYINDIQQQQCNLSGKVPGYSMFFLETILVPPMKFRPPAKANDSVMEHPHTVLLGKVLHSNIAVVNSSINFPGRSNEVILRLMDLQQSVNVFFDCKTAASKAQNDGISGICQYLEKKEGLFRQKMMGKRVNFACRSVISPDPYLSANEIGIPTCFALKLTYPERVTPWNAAKLRNAVINGGKIHPGATKYVDGAGLSVNLLSLGKNARLAISRKVPSSRGSQSGKNSEVEYEGKIVYRHLRDGDIVLVNRQPTLHKPSIMAHVVRVLKGEKTLRMHYANCSSYNADFDGDEINVHFPQDEISRAEGYNIVNANEQYIVPTRGDTVRGLIQDHIVSAVLLTMKNTFLTRAEFSQLLYGSGVFAHGSGSLSGNHSLKVSLNDSGSLMDPVLPAVWKPVPLWTGKQVITALLNQITRGRGPCTVENQGKVPKNYFTGNNDTTGEEEKDQNAEHNFLVWKNELVRGVIDKAQFGKFGLVHTVQELYGSNSAGILLSALSRLFTLFLQIHGFTCGLDDLIILPRYDAQRKDKLEGEDVGEEVHCNFVKFKPGQIGPEELQLEIEKVICSDRESSTASLDMKMKNKLTNKLTTEGSQILKHLLTAGLLKPFPKNCISVMTTTGAKGSTVNFQQISAYLGQQELEGKRVPRMVSGKTLPSFPPWDYQSRAGGFITDRFLTGLRPQEYYFHCMAGREGLVDTAVKTSRSGYLQRCLIKNLESLKVCYDCTVRDADGSIVQFYYGEDGVDVHQTSFLTNFKALEDNRETMCEKFQNQFQFNGYIEKMPEGLEEAARIFIQDRRHHKKRKGGKEQRKFLDLVKQKYISSLVPSGEPVGIIAAQSVGEPSTQMTLNTFHLAGRGEMNVTLGIPRLQEILMTASETIKTPLLTCPLLEWRPKNDVVSLASRAKKVTVADLVESMEVQLSFQHLKMRRIYKLIIILKDTEFVPLEDVHETLKTTFLRELEDAIENHVVILSRISGIHSTNSKSTSGGESSNEGEEEEALPKTEAAAVGDDDDDEEDEDETGDDLGSDVQKRKMQASDELDYEDGSEGELSEEEHVNVETDRDNSEAEEIKHTDVDGDNVGDMDEDMSEEAEEIKHTDVDGDNVGDMDEDMSEAKPSGKERKPGSKIIEKPRLESRKKTDRHMLTEAEGLSFTIKFIFTKEPHFLLCQLAQKTAKKVFIKKSGKLSQCKMVEYDPGEKSVIWDENKKPKRGETNETCYWAVKASGDDFRSFWDMHDDLDLSRLYSNNIHAVLKMYGVEAARATLIREVKNVFDIYGVKIDFRHLSLIADYMTHAGGYRPMSRHGGIADSVSPFLKMTFETASKFIVEAASRGLADNLESPSARVCLGLPVKMGTGSFDLLQKFDG